MKFLKLLFQNFKLEYSRNIGKKHSDEDFEISQFDHKPYVKGFFD